MSDRSDIAYRYDGSFEGLMCCVFESYQCKEIPAAILSPAYVQQTMFGVKEIETDLGRSARVLAAIPGRMGAAVLPFIRHAFLTCLNEKERYILLFVRIGFREGAQVMSMLADDTVDVLTKAVRYLEREAHLFREFVRFSEHNGVLVSEIEPNNIVLPLILPHFCERLPEERFLIHDITHGMALAYEQYHPVILPVEAIELPEPDEEEIAMRTLWQLFYDTVEIKGRHNPKCRMGHMPKRYWRHLTEFDRPFRAMKARSDSPQGFLHTTPLLPDCTVPSLSAIS
ncbi:MAG: TIGR03915 family putative DNA repair protein [Acetanaerobacterium sp.]